MASVELKNITKSYDGSEQILEDFSLIINEGEFFTIVGPSGCGKSTLLRIIAGLEPVSSGEVWIGGQDMTKVSPKDRDIAMVFQNYALYPHMNVYDNIGFGLKMRKTPKEEIRGRVEDVARRLGISDLLKRKPKELSGGQKQRVALGRAIARKPRVFLFDEPLSNLDAHLRVDMRAELKSLHQTLGKTMIYVTHDQVEAMTLSDRILLLKDGQPQQIGAPMELYHHPENQYTASFFGMPNMNFFKPGELAGIEAGEGITTLGIRPEHIHLGEGAYSGVVTLVEPLGNETVVTLDEKVKARLDHQAAIPTTGEQVRWAVDHAKIHRF